MPTQSASDYTNFIKLKAAALSYTQGGVPKAIQSTDQPVPTVSILNAKIITSPFTSDFAFKGSIRPRNAPQTRSNPDALSTLSWTSGTSGSVGSTTSSKYVGGVPANGRVGTYTRLPQISH